MRDRADIKLLLRANAVIRQLLMRLLPWILIFPMAAHAQSPSTPTSDQAALENGRQSSDILSMDIDQLAKVPVVVPSMDIPVASVTKEMSTVGRSAAAVFVVTNQMIRESGATCVPEALRMVPGLDVAQINSNAWAITCRGFNWAYSTKLLVMIDGRSVYIPDFSGVYWNMQDVMLEDVDRIEVVRGPGGTLWGANAVNGIINIITKKSQDTQGAYATVGGGSQKQLLDGFRYGGQSGDLSYRVFGKQFEIGPGYDPAGLNRPASDAWRQAHFGFRTDWEPDRDKSNTFTLQGDCYMGNTDNCIIPTAWWLPYDQSGENLLARWRHVIDDDSDWTLQTYYDGIRCANSLQTETVKTFDVDFQYRFPFTSRQSITCGVGFRNVESYFAGGDSFANWFPYPSLTTNYTNQFIQDEIDLIEDRLTLTLGTKLEENPYTGGEYQPTARLLFTPDRRHSAWGAISRAVRTPARYEEQGIITQAPVAPNIYPQVFGMNLMDSEVLWAYELGYRVQATEKFSWDIATFYNSYTNLVAYSPLGSPQPADPIILPFYVDNGPTAQSYGVELACNYTLSERWRLYTQYTYFQLHVYPPPGSNTPSGNDPCNQVYFHSIWNLQKNLELDMMARYVDSIMALEVPSYITMDLRLAWKPRKYWELAIVGQNLLQAHHWEFGGNVSFQSNTYATEVPRGIYGTVTWRR